MVGFLWCLYIGTRDLQEWKFDYHFRISIPSPIPVPELHHVHSLGILMENMENGDGDFRRSPLQGARWAMRLCINPFHTHRSTELNTTHST